MKINTMPFTVLFTWTNGQIGFICTSGLRCFSKRKHLNLSKSDVSGKDMVSAEEAK